MPKRLKKPTGRIDSRPTGWENRLGNRTSKTETAECSIPRYSVLPLDKRPESKGGWRVDETLVIFSGSTGTVLCRADELEDPDLPCMRHAVLTGSESWTLKVNALTRKSSDLLHDGSAALWAVERDE